MKMLNKDLYHYGVQGMKWGVRRYQNADGTLTEAGKKKYSSSKTRMETRINNLNSKNARYSEKAEKNFARSEKVKQRTPSFYITGIGKKRRNRLASKAIGLEGKALRYQKKIEKNISKMSVYGKRLDDINVKLNIDVGEEYIKRILK